MYKNVGFRILAGFILLAAIAGIAYFAYQAGVNQGAAVPVINDGVRLPIFYPLAGFGFFGLMIAFFLVMVAMASMRHLIWGPRISHRYLRHSRLEHAAPWGEGVPPFFKEWHDRAHTAPEDDKAPAGDQK
jgi:hypothetical protein